MHGYYYEPFTVPFIIGVIFLFAKIWTRFFSWISVLPKSDRKLIMRNAVSKHAVIGLWKAFLEILLHRRMFSINKRLWYMHMSLAFGWFLMIVVSKIEVALYLGNLVNPPYVEVFFNYYFPHYNNEVIDFIMDFLLLFVLSGLAVAIFKRRNLSKFGLSQRIRRPLLDSVVMYVLWSLFPLRLLCESVNGGVYDTGGFLTGNLGEFFASFMSPAFIYGLNEGLWWLYSIATAIFLVLLPFSRYLHIFAEIPLIFLRNFGVKAKERPSTFTFLESAACSRCGLCLEVCPMVKSGVAAEGDPLNFIRSVRSRNRKTRIVDNCFMCGECERICPVGVEHKTIRIGERYLLRHANIKHDFKYIKNRETSEKEATVGYFAGCASHLDADIIESVKTTFNRFSEKFKFIDAEGDLCCGASLKSAGYISDAENLTGILVDRVLKSGVTKLVFNCPTCYEHVSKDERLAGMVESLLYTDYVASKLDEAHEFKKTDVNYYVFTPCSMQSAKEKVVSARKIVSMIGNVSDLSGSNMCCGGSIHNSIISHEQRNTVACNELSEIEGKADCIVTLCPKCKNMLKRNTQTEVCDISELVMRN